MMLHPTHELEPPANRGRFTFLEAGHSPATLRRHPATGKDQFYLSERDVAEFHSMFMTLPTIAQSSGKDRSWIRAWLHKTGIKPFAPNGADYGKTYLRKDLKTLLN